MAKTESQIARKQKDLVPFHHRHPYLTAFLVNLVLGMLTFLPYIIKDHGLFIISYDFNAEQIPFNIYVNNSIKAGNTGWSWQTDMGSDFLTSYSFYNLGSPFFWLSCLFPGKYFPWLVGWFYMLKYAVCGEIAFLYLRRHTRKFSSALAGSILYAFSGFNACNIVFYHFHEVVAFFPLLIDGMDRLLEENKRGFFLFAVALNALVNYNFFVGEVLFVILYYLVRHGIAEYKKGYFWKGILSCLVEGILGVGIACILFLPSCLSLMNNPRVSTYADWKQVFFDAGDYLLILRALFFPSECMANISVGTQSTNWYSTALYLPVLGPAFTIAFVSHDIRASHREKRRWNYLTCMLILCLILSLFYFPNSMFVLFTVEPYRRWYYMYLLFMVLATAKVLDEPSDYPWKPSLIVCLAISIGFVLTCLYKKEWILNEKVFLAISAVGVAGYLLVLFLFSVRRFQRRRMHLLLAMLAVCAVLTTQLSITVYRFGNGENYTAQDYYNDIIATSADLDPDLLPYRYRFWDVYYNRALAGNLPSVNSFNSTVEPSITEFYQAMLGGEGRHTMTVPGPNGTDELLSVASRIDCIQWEEREASSIIEEGGHQIYVYTDENALPIGFVMHQYITSSDFQSLSVDQRGIAMLRYLVVPDEETELAEKAGMTRASVDASTVFTDEDKSAAVEALRPESSTSFDYDTHFFSSDLTANGDGYAFFSVPYSEGWHCTVDGESVSIMKVNGLMAVPVTDGAHHICFTYRSSARILGEVLSLVSLLLSVGYVIYWRKKGRKIRKI